jgi:hypothetical protein
MPNTIVITIIIKHNFAILSKNAISIIQDKSNAPTARTEHPRTILPDTDSDQTIILATINKTIIKNIVNKNPLTRIIKIQLNNKLARGQKVVIVK